MIGVSIVLYNEFGRVCQNNLGETVGLVIPWVLKVLQKIKKLVFG
jgi:hypothetical protein